MTCPVMPCSVTSSYFFSYISYYAIKVSQEITDTAGEELIIALLCLHYLSLSNFREVGIDPSGESLVVVHGGLAVTYEDQCA